MTEKFTAYFKNKMLPILTLKNITKTFDGRNVVNNISFDIKDGEFVSILGKSGSGKTTLLRMIAGFEKVDSGEIYFADRMISSKNKHIAAEQREIAIVFQDHALWPHMTVFENVAFPLKVKKKSSKDIESEVREALAIVEMEGFENALPHELSGGESQRIALARALVQHPRMIIFDEPLASLDATLRFELQGEIKRLHKEKKITCLYITHDQNEAMRISDKIVVLENGVLTQFDVPESVYKQPATLNIAKLMGRAVCLDVNILEADGNKARIAIEGYAFNANFSGHHGEKVCVKAEDVHFSERGLAVNVTECSYMGGYYLLQLSFKNKPKIKLFCYSQIPYEVGEGKNVEIAASWLIPG